MSEARAFRVTIQSDVIVGFSDHKKAYAFFIKGDWKESFYTFYTLDEVADHIAFNFINTHETFDSTKRTFYKFIEGYGQFYREEGRYDVFKITSEEVGDIFVTIERELEVDWVEEINEEE